MLRNRRPVSEDHALGDSLAGMPYREHFYPEARFGGFTDIDGSVVFYSRVSALATPSACVLDVGCGIPPFDPVPFRRSLRTLKGRVRQVVGIDVDRSAARNPTLDEFRLIEDDTWPVETGSADMILCDHVLEHLTDPDAFFSEAARALRSGGCLCIRTPNRRSYVGIAARLVPNRHHATLLSIVQSGRGQTDVFPTLYRCNTRRKIAAAFSRFGFEGTVYGYEAEPAYLSFSRIAYALGVLHQRLAPAAVKPVLFGFARRV